MAKYKYPCIFHKDKETKGWWAEFPDWHNTIFGVTDGQTWQQVLFMADDLLNLMCLDLEEEGREFPVPDSYDKAKFPLEGKDVIRYITADTDKYRIAIKQFKRVGRYRMTERARERYWYHKPPFSPEEEEFGGA